MNRPIIKAHENKNKKTSRFVEYELLFFIICKSKRAKRIRRKNQLDEGEDMPEVNGRKKTRIRREKEIKPSIFIL